MKLENQVCSVEQAKRLVELGITNESLFSYYEKLSGDDFEVEIKQSQGTPFKAGFAPALTVAELFCAMMMDCAGNLMPSLSHYHDWMNEQHINHKSAASLHAALLIHFLESKVFTPAEVNARLQS